MNVKGRENNFVETDPARSVRWRRLRAASKRGEALNAPRRAGQS
jgi:hypothetical protein